MPNPDVVDTVTNTFGHMIRTGLNFPAIFGNGLGRAVAWIGKTFADGGDGVKYSEEN